MAVMHNFHPSSVRRIIVAVFGIACVGIVMLATNSDNYLHEDASPAIPPSTIVPEELTDDHEEGVVVPWQESVAMSMESEGEDIVTPTADAVKAVDKVHLVRLERTPLIVVPEELLAEADGGNKKSSGGDAYVYASLLTNNANTQYFGSLYVGTPAIKFKVVYDTGSSVLWVPDSNCKSSACKSHHQFSLHHSQTGKLMGADTGMVKEAKIQYGTGSMTGVEALDTIRMGGIKGIEMKNSGLLLATKEDSSIFSNFPFDGVFGLNRREVLSGGTDFNVMRNAKKNGSVKKNMVSFWLGGAPGHKGGAMAVGGVDNRFFDETQGMSWHKVIENPFGNWMLQLDSLKIGDIEVCPGGCTTIIDTGTSLLVTSQPVHDKIKTNMDIMPDCSNYNSNPALTFTYDGTTYVLEANDYTVEMVSASGSKRCSSAIVPMEGTLLKTIGKIVPNNPTQVIVMGDVFLRRIYTAFDNSNPKAPRVGFARAKASKEVEDIMSIEAEFEG